LDLKSIPLADPPLQTTIRSAEFVISFSQPENVNFIKEKINSILSAPSLMRERRGKAYDLRPLIHSLVIMNGISPSMVMKLSAMPGATGRPEEVLASMGLDPINVEVTRTALVFDNNHD